MNTQKDKIHIALASNNGYVVLLAALIKSIDYNHKGDKEIVFHILNDKISSKNQNKVNASIINSPKIKLRWIDAENVFPKGIKFPADNSAFPKTAYLRLFAPYILDKEVKKLLYFDVDMIVKNDVSELWNIDLKGYTMAAVLDVGKTVGCAWGGIPNYKELGLPADAKYFNSGLMIIDCEKWRHESIPKKYLKPWMITLNM